MSTRAVMQPLPAGEFYLNSPYNPLLDRSLIGAVWRGADGTLSAGGALPAGIVLALTAGGQYQELQPGDSIAGVLSRGVLASEQERACQVLTFGPVVRSELHFPAAGDPQAILAALARLGIRSDGRLPELDQRPR